jgi:uroporphyrinogen decarboxylase
MRLSEDLSLPNKARMTAVLRHELPDRVPNFEVLVDNPTLRYVMGREVAGGHTYANIDPRDYIEFVTRIGQDVVGMSFQFSPFREVDAQGQLVDLSFQFRSRNDLDRVKIVGVEALADQFALLDRYVSALEGTNIGLFVTMAAFFTDTYTSLFGFENFMYMLADDRELVEEVLELHTNFQVAVAERVAEYPLTFFYPADDLAYKSGTIIRPELIREIWVPRMRRIFAPALAKDIPILFHSDGNIEALIPDLLDMGISALNPLEPYGMDIREIKKRYGRYLTLVGNMDVGGVLSTGTPEQARAEARQLIDDIGLGGGYVLASCHSITSNVQPENFLAMVRSALEYGRY